MSANLSGTTCRAVGLAMTLVAALVLPRPVTADTSQRLQSLRSSVLQFVCEMPAPEADLASAIEMLRSVDVDTLCAHPGVGTTTSHGPAPAVNSDAALLHLLGYHLHYHLLPERMREFYWHPSQCRGAMRPQEPAALYDEFAEAAAELFVACFSAYADARGFKSEVSTPGSVRPCGLVSAYGDAVHRQPTKVYGDFVQATIAFSRRCWKLELPARTLYQWRLARKMYGGLPGASIQASFPVDISPPHDHIIPLRPGTGLDAQINEAGAPSEAVALRSGDRIELGARPALLQLDGDRCTVVAGRHSRLAVLPGGELYLKAGQALAIGPVAISTKHCEVHTGAGGTTLRVNAAGETTVGAVERTSIVTHAGKETRVTPGMVMTVPAAGPILGPGAASPIEVVYTLADIASPQTRFALTALPDPPASVAPTVVEVEPEPVEQSSPDVASESDEWAIFKPDLLKDVVLCSGISTRNEPEGISDTFDAAAGLITLFVHLDFGRTERTLGIKWAREGRVLTARSVHAKGTRKFANNLRAGANSAFTPGDYEVELDIDGHPAAILGFTVK